ncbi:hypothetical protein OOK36_23130 [Streptomyces sp. NBC_00365]|uniref:hypothetical protein n=1 Tax=Streptomyces sp. NBC_00365 TaxID=2975726 RepID=UPI00224DBBE5|nr:hypothetical protein [Streptomyces sp. NBC_00365]MCX5091722.1 hypothetical protein [Streptomyces sp. NBC_00365]
MTPAYKRVYFSNRFGRLLALDDPGDKVQSYAPRVLLVEDAIVAMAGDTAFSRSPDGPT